MNLFISCYVGLCHRKQSCYTFFGVPKMVFGFEILLLHFGELRKSENLEFRNSGNPEIWKSWKSGNSWNSWNSWKSGKFTSGTFRALV